MKIGIDCHNLEGQRTGVGRYVWNLLKEWSNESRITNHALVPSSSRGESRVEFFLYFKNEIPEDVLGFFRNMRGETMHMLNLNGRSDAIFKHWLLPRAARSDGVDVLFCPDYVLPFYTGRNIKTVVTIHDIIYEARPNEYSWPSIVDKILLRWASKQSVKKADTILVPSEFTKNEILKYYKVDPEKVVVTLLASDSVFKKIDLDGDNPRLDQKWEEIKKKYGIHDKFIFFVGSIFNRRFLPQKIEAFIEFAKNYKNFQFFIIGNNHTKPYQDIAALVREANRKLGRNAIIHGGHIKDDRELSYLYNGAYLTLWLSSYEGFGLPVLESMACGTPVITSMKGSLPEIAGDAAMYVACPDNPAEISSSLTYLARHSLYYDELVEKGLLQAQKFSWQKTAEDTLRSILQVLR